MRFDSYDEMAQKWAASMADPDWQEIRGASEANGPIVAQIRRRVLSLAAFD